MLKKILVSTIIITILGLSIWWIKNIDFILFLNAPWALIVSFISGIVFGVIRAAVNARSYKVFVSMDRHTVDSFLEHWGTMAGILLLIYSGFRTSSGGLFAMNLHFLGIFVTLFFGCYFLADFFISKKYESLLPDGKDIIRGTIGKYFFRSQWKERGKYLSSQKAAFLTFAIIGSEILITGVAKAVALLRPMPPESIRILTLIHDISGGLFVLMLLVHILLVISIRSHRQLLGFWLSGDSLERYLESSTTRESFHDKIEKEPVEVK